MYSLSSYPHRYARGSFTGCLIHACSACPERGQVGHQAFHAGCKAANAARIPVHAWWQGTVVAWKSTSGRRRSAYAGRMGMYAWWRGAYVRWMFADATWRSAYADRRCDPVARLSA